jgi:hypothetical protein
VAALKGASIQINYLQRLVSNPDELGFDALADVFRTARFTTALGKNVARQAST